MPYLCCCCGVHGLRDRPAQAPEAEGTFGKPALEKAAILLLLPSPHTNKEVALTFGELQPLANTFAARGATGLPSCRDGISRSAWRCRQQADFRHLIDLCCLSLAHPVGNTSQQAQPWGHGSPVLGQPFHPLLLQTDVANGACAFLPSGEGGEDLAS